MEIVRKKYFVLNVLPSIYSIKELNADSECSIRKVFKIFR